MRTQLQPLRNGSDCAAIACCESETRDPFAAIDEQDVLSRIFGLSSPLVSYAQPSQIEDNHVRMLERSYRRAASSRVGRCNILQ